MHLKPVLNAILEDYALPLGKPIGMTNKTLSHFVRIYKRKHGPRLAAYLGYFQTLDSIEDAIRFACHGKEGKIHGHQHLFGKAKLEQARKELQKYSEEIAVTESFDDLLTLVEDHTSSIYRFGVLAVYDTTLRLGAYLDVWPEVVYLHAGTKKGCKALGMVTKGGTVEMDQLPKPIRSLEPYQAEDFLCIFKDQFRGEDGEVKERLPRGC